MRHDVVHNYNGECVGNATPITRLQMDAEGHVGREKHSPVGIHIAWVERTFRGWYMVGIVLQGPTACWELVVGSVN